MATRKGGAKSALDSLYQQTEQSVQPPTNIFPDTKFVVEELLRGLGRTYAAIPLEKIIANPYQPRKHFLEESIKSLASSIEQDGLLKPISVRYSPTRQDIFEIAEGERRYRAFQLLGKATIPAEILQGCSNEKMQRIAVVENIQREDLTPMELAMAYEALYRDEQGNKRCSLEELAQQLSVSLSNIDDHFALLRAPKEAQQLIIDDPTLPLRLIRNISGIENEVDRVFLVEQVRSGIFKNAEILDIIRRFKQERSLPKKVHKRETEVKEQEKISVQTENDEQGVHAASPPLKNPSEQRDVPEQAVQVNPLLLLATTEQQLLRDQVLIEKIALRLRDEYRQMTEDQKACVVSYTEKWKELISQIPSDAS